MSQATLPEVLTLEEVAAYLRLAPETILHHAGQGQLPGRQIEGNWRFLKIAIDDWLRSQPKHSSLLQQPAHLVSDSSCLQPAAIPYAGCSKEEAELLQHINVGLLPEVWEQYHNLIAKRRTETLTLEEQAILIQISDQVESMNVERMQYLIQLANLRGQSLQTVMQDLGIQTPAYL